MKIYQYYLQNDIEEFDLERTKTLCTFCHQQGSHHKGCLKKRSGKQTDVKIREHFFPFEVFARASADEKPPVRFSLTPALWQIGGIIGGNARAYHQNERTCLHFASIPYYDDLVRRFQIWMRRPKPEEMAVLRKIFVHVKHREKDDPEVQKHRRGYQQVDRSHSVYPLFKIELIGQTPRSLRISSLYKLVDSQIGLVNDTLRDLLTRTEGNGRDIVGAVAALLLVEKENGAELMVDHGTRRERLVFWRTFEIEMPWAEGEGGVRRRQGAALGKVEVVRGRPTVLPFGYDYIVADFPVKGL